MIGIDTNILLRLLLDDDATQRSRIEKLFNAHARAPGSALVSDIVLAEAVSTLGSAYRQPKASILAALNGLLAQPAFAFENWAAVEQAVLSYASGRAGFSDGLIVAKNAAAGCAFTATFDRALRGTGNARVL